MIVGLLFEFFVEEGFGALSLSKREGTCSRSRWNFVSLASSLIIPLYLNIFVAAKLLAWREGLALLGLFMRLEDLRRVSRDKGLLRLLLWVLFAVVCERIAKIMSIQTVQFIETVYAFVALYRTSHMWYSLPFLLLFNFSRFIYCCTYGMTKIKIILCKTLEILHSY